MNQICEKCINYCNDKKNGLDLIKYSEQESIKIGNKIGTEKESDLYFAPAGNFPNDPIITICGLATSVQAKDYIYRKVDKNENQKRKICLNSVYQGTMAKNLAFMLKSLQLNRRIGENTIIRINDTAYSINELSLNEIKESKGIFEEVPEKLHLTQSTCCWSIDGKSQFNKEWWDYSKFCRSNGYFKNLINRFINSKRSKLFILLGSFKNQNMNIINEILRNSTERKKIAILTPELWKNTCTKETEKIICLIHHPANAGHVYNNCKNSENKSTLYSYFESNGWDFEAAKYGNVKSATMGNIKNYYKYLSKEIFEVTREL